MVRSRLLFSDGQLCYFVTRHLAIRTYLPGYSILGVSQRFFRRGYGFYGGMSVRCTEGDRTAIVVVKSAFGGDKSAFSGGSVARDITKHRARYEGHGGVRSCPQS